MARSFEELLNTRPMPRSGTNEEVVLVSAEEARLLAAEGASVSSGFEGCADGESTCGTQRYRIGGKTFLWLEGLFTRTVTEPYPV